MCSFRKYDSGKRRVRTSSPSRGDASLYLDRARMLAGLAGFISIPDTPGGEARACGAAVAARIRDEVGVRVVVHVKTVNSNRVGIFSQVLGAALAGAGGVLITRGDRPREGVVVQDVYVEEVFGWARSRSDLSRLKLGVTIPVPRAYPEKLVRRRLRLRPDFVYTQVVSKPAEVVDVAKYLQSFSEGGIEIYVPVIVPSELNREAVKAFEFEPVSCLEGVVEEAVRHGVNILLSSPADFEAGLKALKKVRELLG